MQKTLNAELWDKMHYLFRDYNDRMIHIELHYDFEINIEAFKTVLLCFFEKAPVFHSSFTPSRVDPYWTVKQYSIDDVVTVKDVDESNLKEEIDNFLVTYIPPESDVQMKVCIFRHSGKTTICIVQNHMCMDGGDVKYFLKAFCQNYNDYVYNGVSPVNFKTGSRSYDTVYSGFSATEKRMARNLYKNINEKDKHAFPLTKSDKNDKSFIARRKISEDKFLALKASGKRHGASLNDMLLTAYFYSLYEISNYNVYDSVSISCAIDLRRHMKSANNTGVTNHTAWMQCRVPELGKDIFDTLQYVVRSSTKFKKDKFMGLYGLPLLSLGYKLMPYSMSEEIIKIGYSNPLVAMSNIGVIEVEKLALEGHEPTDGFLSGAVKYKPFVLLSATTMRNVITFSMCVRGNDEDKKIIEKFYDLMEKNIDLLIGE